MVTKTKVNKAQDKAAKPKAARLAMTQLVVLGAWERKFSTGKSGFFGQVQDPMTGKRYQVIGAVELAPKAS